MRRLGAIGFAVLLASGTAAAARDARPTVTGCLRAWNAPGNAANQRELVSLRGAVVSLEVGVAGVDTVSRGAKRSTSSPACLLTIAHAGRVDLVSGIWSARGAVRWHFFPPTQAKLPAPPGNARITARGRLARA